MNVRTTYFSCIRATIYNLSCSTGERQRLADAVKQHRINHTTVPDQPEGKGHA